MKPAFAVRASVRSGVVTTCVGTRFSIIAPGSFTMTDSDDQQIYVNAISFVPEPGTAILLGLGLAVLGGVRRRA